MAMVEKTDEEAVCVECGESPFVTLNFRKCRASDTKTRIKICRKDAEFLISELKRALEVKNGT